MAERKYLMLLRPPQQPCLVARQTTFLLISPGIRRVLFGGVCIRCTTRMPYLWGCSAHDNALGGTAFFGFYGLWLFCCDSTIALPQERPSFGQPFTTIAHTILLEQFMSGFLTDWNILLSKNIFCRTLSSSLKIMLYYHETCFGLLSKPPLSWKKCCNIQSKSIIA